MKKYDLINTSEFIDLIRNRQQQTHNNEPLISDDDKLDLMRQVLRREIRRELKIQEGADKLRRASTDRKAWSNVDKMIKSSNCKLQELNDDLAELERFMVEYHSGSSSNKKINNNNGVIITNNNNNNNNNTKDVDVVRNKFENLGLMKIKNCNHHNHKDNMIKMFSSDSTVDDNHQNGTTTNVESQINQSINRSIMD